jgi:hypothetical protein
MKKTLLFYLVCVAHFFLFLGHFPCSALLFDFCFGWACQVGLRSSRAEKALGSESVLLLYFAVILRSHRPPGSQLDPCRRFSPKFFLLASEPTLEHADHVARQSPVPAAVFFFFAGLVLAIFLPSGSSRPVRKSVSAQDPARAVGCPRFGSWPASRVGSSVLVCSLFPGWFLVEAGPLHRGLVGFGL